MKIRRVIVFTCALVMAFACMTGAAHAAQVYVSVEGSDTAGNGSASAPYATIQHGIDEASWGDSVIVGPGTFTECVTLVNGVSLFGAGADQTTIDAEGHGSVVSGEDIGPTVAVEGFTLTGGVAAEGGGVHLDQASPRIAHNTIIDNQGLEFGGGVYMLNSSPMIDGNVIRGNSGANDSWTRGWGGGIYTGDVSRPVIANNIIDDNECYGDGGGIDTVNAAPVIYNNVITNNYSGYYGGGIDSATTQIGPVVIMNNTVVGNTSDITWQAGGIEWDGQGQQPIVFNTIVWGNGGDQLWRIDPIYSCVEDGAVGEGNISVDPSFVDAAAGDYSLKPDSPCINAGVGQGAPYPVPTTDIRGIPRPQLWAYDIGAYEFCLSRLKTSTQLSALSKYKAGRTFTLRGTVTPAVAPGQVRIYREFLSDGHWVQKGSATVDLVEGSFVYRYSTRTKGTWRFKAMYLGGEIPDVTMCLRSGSSWQRSLIY